MPTYAQLEAESWWGREIVTPELDWLGDELCRRTGRPRVAAGSKGDNVHLRGAHRSQEWILNSRWCTNRTYTVQPGLTAAQLRHIAGFDFTPGSATAMIAQCKRLMAAIRGGDLEDVREFYGNVDGDQVVDGWDNLRNRAATSDSTHLWHWHLSIDRRKLRDTKLMERIAMIALGDEEDEMPYRNWPAEDRRALARDVVDEWFRREIPRPWDADDPTQRADLFLGWFRTDLVRTRQAVAELRGELAGLTTLVANLAGGIDAPLSADQFAQLLDAIRQAAREPGEQLAAALAAAAEAVTRDDGDG
ncbi:MAG TPA: hypothetical protein VF062_06490 [Candidatus Limnocylindrales bacterium]